MWILMLFIVGISVSLGIYFLPTIIAFSKHKRNKGAIFALNFLLGFTFIGWIVSLVWALTNNDTPVVKEKVS